MTDVKVTWFTVTDVMVTGFNQLFIVTDGESHILADVIAKKW